MHEGIESALINAKDEELEHTFRQYEGQEHQHPLTHALFQLIVEGRSEIVVRCLRLAQDAHPEDDMYVSPAVNAAISLISISGDSEPTYTAHKLVSHASFVSFVALFNPTDVKPLASIREKIFLKRMSQVR